MNYELTNDERAYLQWRREEIETHGSARGRTRQNWEGAHVPAWLEPSRGEWLVVLRRRIGWSVKQAAQRLLVSHVTILRYERDERRDSRGYTKALEKWYNDLEEKKAKTP